MSKLVTVTAFLISVEDKPHLAVEFTIAPKWHIYWENPGQSGLATEVEATGLDEDLLYLGPERISAAGGLVNYGYHNQTTIFGAVDSNYTLQDAISISWLVCKEDQCIRQSTSIQAQKPNTQQQAKIKQTFATLPKPMPSQIKPNTNEKQFALVWPNAVELQVFPDEDLELVISDMKIHKQTEGSQLQIKFKRPPPKQAGGIVGVKINGKVEYYLLSL